MQFPPIEVTDRATRSSLPERSQVAQRANQLVPESAVSLRTENQVSSNRPRKLGKRPRRLFRVPGIDWNGVKEQEYARGRRTEEDWRRIRAEDTLRVALRFGPLRFRSGKSAVGEGAGEDRRRCLRSRRRLRGMENRLARIFAAQSQRCTFSPLFAPSLSPLHRRTHSVLSSGRRKNCENNDNFSRNEI